jgi:hypothetical protein
MQKFSGIYMGRRRKQTGETEAEMEGSGEDSEPQILAGFAKELQHSINQTQSTLVHHLQENQEAVRRGQLEITETLERVNASQEKLAQLLLQMTHAGKGPRFMQTGKLVDLMGELDISRSIALVITLRDRVMEVELLRGKHTVGPPLDPIYLHSWITSHNATMRMKLRTTLSSMPRSIMP